MEICRDFFLDFFSTSSLLSSFYTTIYTSIYTLTIFIHYTLFPHNSSRTPCALFVVYEISRLCTPQASNLAVVSTTNFSSIALFLSAHSPAIGFVCQFAKLFIHDRFRYASCGCFVATLRLTNRKKCLYKSFAELCE